MKHIFKSSLSLTLVFALILSSFAFAAPGDVYKKADNQLYAKGSELANLDPSDAKLMTLSNDPESYFYEAKDKKVFNLSDAFDAYAKDKANFSDVLANDAKPADVVPNSDDSAVVPLQTGDLEVVKVEAASKISLDVTFNKEIDAVAINNFKVAVAGKTLNIERVTVDATKKIVTVKVPDMNYGDVVELDVTGVTSDAKPMASYNTIYTIPAVDEFYELKVTSEDDKILADGATKTMITVELVDKKTGEAADVDGLIIFTTTKGEFAQSTVSLQDGKASVQLQSSASDEIITAFITATVKDAPNNREYEGISGKHEVQFVPKGVDIEENIQASIQSVESNQADRVSVTMNKEVNRKQIINAFTGRTFEDRFKKAQADSFGFLVDGEKIVKDIVQVSPTNLVLILDVDNAMPTSMVPGITNVTQAYMRDNISHTVSIPDNLDTVLIKSSQTFKLTDNKFPTIFGVDVDANRLIRVRFSEAMAEDKVEHFVNTDGHNINEHFKIDGKGILLTADPKRASVEEKAYATQHNKILANRLYVGTDDNADRGQEEGYYFKSANNATDSRHIVTIILDKSSRLKTGEIELQASDIGDWAYMTDPANVVQTQTFKFNINADASKPDATVVMQSPEQWLIKFNQEVDSVLGKKAKDVFAVYSNDKYTENPKVAFEYGVDYKIYQVDAEDAKNASGEPNFFNGTEVKKDDLVNGKYFLIEFTKDWTQEYNTNSTKVNYFHSTKNPYIITVDNVENMAANKMDAKVLELMTPYDGVSPSLTFAKDVYEMTDNKANNQIASSPGEFIYVEMDEPIKMMIADAKNNVSTANVEGATPSYKQGFADSGVPVPTYEFVKGNDSVPGQYVATSLAADDYSFVIKPETALSAGEWTVYIRSISDDIGNTSATASYSFTVEEAEAVSSDTRIAWAAFDNVGKNATSGYDRIYIKFTKPMSVGDANSVNRTSNYSFKNQVLPQTTSIKQGIKGITNDWDGVTIIMPRDTWDGLNGNNADFTSVFNVANNFKSADGDKLMGPYEIELVTTGRTDSLATYDENMDFEAIYRNAAVGDVIGSAHTFAEAEDNFAYQVTWNSTDNKVEKYADNATKGKDGKIDTIKLSGGSTSGYSNATGEETKIYVNDKEFVWNGSDAFVATKGNEIDGTDTRNLKITNASGQLIFGAPFVIDRANPVLKAVKKGDEIFTFIFSEPVDMKSFQYDKFGKLANNKANAYANMSAGLSGTELEADAYYHEKGSNEIQFKKDTSYDQLDNQFIDIYGTSSKPGILEEVTDIPVINTVVNNAANPASKRLNNIYIPAAAASTSNESTGVEATDIVTETKAVEAVSGSNGTFDPSSIGPYALSVSGTSNHSLADYTIEFVDDKSGKSSDSISITNVDPDKKLIVVEGPFAEEDPSKQKRDVDHSNVATNITNAFQAMTTAFGAKPDAKEKNDEFVKITASATSSTTAGNYTGKSKLGAGKEGIGSNNGVYSFEVTKGASRTAQVVFEIAFVDKNGTERKSTITVDAKAGDDAKKIADKYVTKTTGTITINSTNYTVTKNDAVVTLTQSTPEEIKSITLSVK